VPAGVRGMQLTDSRGAQEEINRLVTDAISDYFMARHSGRECRNPGYREVKRGASLEPDAALTAEGTAKGRPIAGQGVGDLGLLRPTTPQTGHRHAKLRAAVTHNH